MTGIQISSGRFRQPDTRVIWYSDLSSTYTRLSPTRRHLQDVMYVAERLPISNGRELYHLRVKTHKEVIFNFTVE